MRGERPALEDELLAVELERQALEQRRKRRRGVSRGPTQTMRLSRQ